MNRHCRNLLRLPAHVSAIGLGMALGLTLCITAPLTVRAEDTHQEVMYGIGSVSKVFTTAAVMRLADEGRIDLDAPVTTYIPEFYMKDSRYKDITPRMLLNHTSGLPGSTLTNAMLMGDPDTYNHDHLLDSLRTQRLKADPGAFATYCNDGFTLAELLVERVTAMSFTDYLEASLTAPLGLTHFKTPQSQLSPNLLAKTYYSGTGSEIPPMYADVIGSGGMFSTAEDLCLASQIFMRQDKNQILSEDALNQMEYSSYGSRLHLNGADTTLEYGLGWDSVNTYPFNHYGIRALSKGGDTLSYHSSLIVLPDEGISCAVVSSGGSSLPDQLAVQEILLTYLDEIGRIDRDETAEIQLLNQKDPDSASSMPADLTHRSGWYDGNQLLKVDIQPDGTLTLSGSDDSYEQQQTYLYRDDGKFHSTSGSYIGSDLGLTKSGNGRLGRSTLEFTTTDDGRSYLMAGIQEAYPGLGTTAVYLPLAEKMGKAQSGYTVDEDTKAAWQNRDGKAYYLVSEKYSSSSYLDQFSIIPRIPQQPEGYLTFKDGFPSMARLTDPLHAEFFQQIPGQAGRDLSDYAIQEVQGREYLVTNSGRYLSEDAVTPLPPSDAVITIGSNGEAVWYSTDETHRNRPLVIETPEHGSYFIYDHSSKDMSCTAGSYLSTPGRQLILPKDGRIVFVGDPGAEFKVHYKNAG